MSTQGAKNGPSQGAGNNQFVKFSRASAHRIAKVVRTVEAGDRRGPGITFEHPVTVSKTVRVCTFSGQWATGTSKVVTFFNVTATPNTITAYNYHLSVDVSSATAECTIAKSGTAWYLISMNMDKILGHVGSELQLLGHDTNGYAQWYSVTTCPSS